MLTIFKKTFSSFIGLDIQADAVQCVELKQIHRQWVLKIHQKEALPTPVFEKGKCIERALLLLTLKKLRKALPKLLLPVKIALPFQSVIVKSIPLPSSLSEFECEMEIEAQLPQYLPGIADKMVFDFVRQKESVLLIATKKETVDFYIALISQAGFQLKKIEVDLYALTRAMLLSAPKNICYGLISMQFDTIYFVVVKSAQIIFHEVIFYSKNALEEAGMQMEKCLQLFCATHHDVILQKIIFAGEDYVFEKIISLKIPVEKYNGLILHPLPIGLALPGGQYDRS